MCMYMCVYVYVCVYTHIYIGSCNRHHVQITVLRKFPFCLFLVNTQVLPRGNCYSNFDYHKLG